MASGADQVRLKQKEEIQQKNREDFRGERRGQRPDLTWMTPKLLWLDY